MQIEMANAMQGNNAMASVLLLYWHLLAEGGITHNQTVYLDGERFDPFEMLHVAVAADLQVEIDQALIREGAFMALLCDLHDFISDYEDDYLGWPLVQRILDAIERSAFAEPASPLVELVRRPISTRAEVGTYQRLLRGFYDRYVVARLRQLILPSTGDG